MFEYRIDVLKELKEAGYPTTRLRDEKILAQCTIQQIRHNKIIGINALEVICKLLDLQPGNIIKYVPDED